MTTGVILAILGFALLMVIGTGMIIVTAYKRRLRAKRARSNIKYVVSSDLMCEKGPMLKTNLKKIEM